MEPELHDWYLSTIGVVQYRLRSALSSTGPVVGSELTADRQINEQSNLQDVEAPSHSEKSVSGIPQSLRDSLGQSKDIAQGKSDSKGRDASASASALSAAPLSTGISEPLSELPPEQIEGQIEGQQADDRVAFRLACWRPSDDLLVIDSWPLGQGGDNRRSQLLANILKSIQRKPGTMMQPEFIDWPIGGDASLSAAREHLAMFIQGRYDQRAFQWLLAMGDDIKLCLSPGKGPDESVPDGDPSYAKPSPSPVNQVVEEKPRLSLSCGAEAIFTHSLSEMLTTPEFKKDVWATIRFLCS